MRQREAVHVADRARSDIQQLVLCSDAVVAGQERRARVTAVVDLAGVEKDVVDELRVDTVTTELGDLDIDQAQARLTHRG